MGDVALQRTSETGLRPWQHGLIFIAACLVIVSRRPETLFHAQFYAEDGHTWFADAYNLGWRIALLRTWGGYFQTVPRIIASLALLLPFSVVPLFFNLLSIGFRVVPASLLMSSRCAEWGSLRFRASLAVMYLVLPNSTEVSYGITNLQWPLALSAFMLLVAPAPQGNSLRPFDTLLIFLCGCAGPFCFFLLPICIFLLINRRDPWQRIAIAIFTACVLAQSYAMLFLAPSARAHRTLGATPQLFARLLAGQIYLGSLLGHNGLAAHPGTFATFALIIIAISGTVLILVIARKMPWTMKLFLAFVLAVFAGGLINPFEWDHPTVPVWMVLAGVPGMRYWFLPTLAFAWTLLYGYKSNAAPVKAISTGLLCLMCMGIARDWHNRTLNETNFAESVKEFEAAPAGTVVTVPEQPLGWNMKLLKHSASQ